MNMLQRAKIIEKQILERRYFLHQNPEIGYELPITASYVKEELTLLGYEVEDIAKCGLTTSVGGKKGGKTILLRADMDALPVKEETGLPYASTNGSMHACGHDVHTASLLGAAQILKELEDELEGTVKFMFQPGEEIFYGATAMIKEGILTNAPVPDSAFAIHVFSHIPVGTMVYGKGSFMASVDGFEIHIKGMGGHGSMPEGAVDPINIGVHIHLALQEILARELSFMNSAALTIGQFSSGTAFNIIPDTAVLKGSLRTMDEGVRTYAKQRMEEIVGQVAATYRGSAELRYIGSLPSLPNDPDFTEQAVSAIEKGSGGESSLLEVPPTAGSEDFSFITQAVPGAMFFAGGKPEHVEKPFANHHPKVLFDDQSVIYAAAAYASVATDWLKNNK